MFINKKEHMALVVDEFGGMEGIVTMEDISETLLGSKIVDESDNTEDMQVLHERTGKEEQSEWAYFLETVKPTLINLAIARFYL